MNNIKINERDRKWLEENGYIEGEKHEQNWIKI